VAVYHVELRQFPHSFCRFNLSEHELRETILSPWVRGEWVNVGERRWSPQQATLTVVESSPLAVQELAMGRGWRNAQRRGQDVIAELLARAWRDAPKPPPEVAAASTAKPAPPARSVSVDAERKALVDALALELLGLLGDRPVPLARAWLLARERNPRCTPSECLALAEAALQDHR
jgi:hypothetical protein